ncbi:MAG: phage holin family protein, partial [Streptosporangiaceae bacterium]|nr:phage holin family protein [Streptosporangiaceae bacterium]
DRTHLVARNGARPAKKTAPADKPAKTTGEESGTLVLRSATPPVDQLDFDDRHDTRATESDELARRYGDLRKDRRRDDWHKLAMGLAGFAVLAAVYLAGFIVVSRLLPHLGPWLAAKIVGLAFVAAGGGVAARSAGRALKQRTARPRDRGSKPA